MASDQARDLRQRGIAAAKSNQREEARTLLQQSIRLDPTSEAAWLWLASVARDAEERRFSLEKLLEINPNNETALKALGTMPADQSPIKRIGESPKRVTGTGEFAQAASGTPAATQAASIPLPTAEKITEAQRQVDVLVREISAPLPQTVKYVKKTKRRAGEGDIVVYRLYLTAGLIGALVLIGLIVGIVLATNEDAQEVVFGPSSTPSNTPTVTWTPTPGVTPTPSTEPRSSLTPSPTVPAEIAGADIYNLPRATVFYPPLLDRALSNAVAALYQGDVRAALPTLAAARELSIEGRFDTIPYYYEALALSQREDYTRAIALLEEAEERREEEAPSDNDAQALIDAAYVQIYFQRAQGANTTQADSLYALMLARAETAIEGDPALVAPYLLVARRLRDIRQYDQAIRVLNQALAVADLSQNTDLIFEKARVYYEQDELPLADYQAFLALYVDPTNEGAHRLRVQIAFDSDDLGEAVQRTQNYLQYYPGSRIGYRFLGDAHRLGGDQNLALEAYARGLNAADDSETTLDMLVARASIYTDQHRYDVARDDLTQALGIRSDVAIQLARMEAAYNAGSYQIAIRDANEVGSRAGNQAWRAQLIEARALVDQDPRDANILAQAQPLLEAAQVSAPASQRGIVLEYLARVQLITIDVETALATIDAAIQIGDSAARRAVRGQILEASDDETGAIREYQWALTLSEIVPYAGRAGIEDRLAALDR